MSSLPSLLGTWIIHMLSFWKLSHNTAALLFLCSGLFSLLFLLILDSFLFMSSSLQIFSCALSHILSSVFWISDMIFLISRICIWLFLISSEPLNTFKYSISFLNIWKTAIITFKIIVYSIICVISVSISLKWFFYFILVSYIPASLNGL